MLASTRGLLQQTSGKKKEADPKCVWDKSEEKCNMNPTLALDFLKKAPESPHKHLISSTLVGGVHSEDCDLGGYLVERRAQKVFGVW